MTILGGNLRKFRLRFPLLDCGEMHHEADDDGFIVEESKAGPPTVKTGGIYLHSRFDPVREAGKLIEAFGSGSFGIVLFEGFGLGYHIEAFIARSPNVPLIIIEPDKGRFMTAMRSRDLGTIFDHPNTLLFIGNDEKDIRAFLGTIVDAHIGVFQLRGQGDRHDTYFASINDFLKKLTARKDVNRNTLKKFGSIWVRNLLRNLRVVPEVFSIRHLADKFPGVPVFLAAAGPSLAAAAPYLGEIRRRCLIVAVDTSVRFLNLHGIQPDFLVVVDPQYWNTKHLEGCRINRSVLVSESTTNPAIFKHSRRACFWCASVFPLGKRIDSLLNIQGSLAMGGSVATTAWDLGFHLGASAVYIAGLDLGFPRMETHYRGSFFEERVHAVSLRVNTAETASFRYLYGACPFPVQNNAGDTVLTDQRMIVYKWWFEDRHKKPESRLTFTLCSEGVKIDGITPCPFDELLDLPERRPEIDGALDTVLAEAVPCSRSGLAEGIDRLAAELSALRELGHIALGILHGEKDPQRLAERLERIDREIMNSAEDGTVSFLLQPLISDIVESGHDAKNLEELNAASLKLYTGILDSAGYHLRFIRRYIS